MIETQDALLVGIAGMGKQILFCLLYRDRALLGGKQESGYRIPHATQLGVVDSALTEREFASDIQSAKRLILISARYCVMDERRVIRSRDMNL